MKLPILRISKSRWSEPAQARAREIVARYPDRRSAVMPLMYLAMREDKWLSDAGIEEVAEWTGLTPAQVRAVATFHGMFKTQRTGRYLISVCTSISCMLRGGDGVLEALEEEAGVPVGETDPEGFITLEEVECLGACGGAPAVQVNYELIEGITPAGARELIKYLRAVRPSEIKADDIQEWFGSRASFDLGVREPEGAIGPFPAFGPYGTSSGGAE